MWVYLFPTFCSRLVFLATASAYVSSEVNVCLTSSFFSSIAWLSKNDISYGVSGAAVQRAGGGDQGGPHPQEKGGPHPQEKGGPHPQEKGGPHPARQMQSIIIPLGSTLRCIDLSCRLRLIGSAVAALIRNASRMVSVVRFERSVADSILSYSIHAYPKEGILLLRGKASKDEVLITDVLIPPLGHAWPRFLRFLKLHASNGPKCHRHLALSSLRGPEAFNSRLEPFLWEDHGDRSLPV